MKCEAKVRFSDECGAGRPDPSGAEQGSKARDDGEIECCTIKDNPLSSFARETDKIHSAYARRASFVAFATFPPFGGGISPKGKAKEMKCAITGL